MSYCCMDCLGLASLLACRVSVAWYTCLQAAPSSTVASVYRSRHYTAPASSAALRLLCSVLPERANERISWQLTREIISGVVYFGER